MRKPVKRHKVTRNGKTFWRGKGSGSAEKSGSGKEFEKKSEGNPRLQDAVHSLLKSYSEEEKADLVTMLRGKEGKNKRLYQSFKQNLGGVHQIDSKDMKDADVLKAVKSVVKG